MRTQAITSVFIPDDQLSRQGKSFELFILFFNAIKQNIIASRYLRAYKAPKKSQYCLAPKFIWGSIKKQNLEQTGFSLLVSSQLLSLPRVYPREPSLDSQQGNVSSLAFFILPSMLAHLTFCRGPGAGGSLISPFLF